MTIHKHSRIVLVTGSRHATRRHLDVVFGRLNTHLMAVNAYELVVMHGAARGVDSMANQWAMNNGVQRIIVPAAWNHGKVAGISRNVLMVDMLATMGLDAFVEAFPMGQSRGTRHCIRYARDRGFTDANMTVTELQ